MCFEKSTQATLRIRLRIFIAGLACMIAGVASPALAQSSQVEMVAELGGRIIGAAKACGLNADRIRRTSERLASMMNSKASSASERDAAKARFATSQSAGAEEVRGERSQCQSVHVEFSEMEVKLGRAPVPESERIAVKRGVPALGVLKSDSAATRKQ